MGLFNWLFRRMCYKIFEHVDRDASGTIEDLEVEIAIYRLYNIINKRLPGWSDPPERSEIRAALNTFDWNKDGSLDRDEFVAFARGLVKNGPDLFFARLGKDAAVKSAVLPFATRGVQAAAGAVGLGPIATAPLHIAAPIAGALFNGIRAVLPIGL